MPIPTTTIQSSNLKSITANKSTLNEWNITFAGSKCIYFNIVDEDIGVYSMFSTEFELTNC